MNPFLNDVANADVDDGCKCILVDTIHELKYNF